LKIGGGKLKGPMLLDSSLIYLQIDLRKNQKFKRKSSCASWQVNKETPKKGLHTKRVRNMGGNIGVMWGLFVNRTLGGILSNFVGK